MNAAEYLGFEKPIPPFANAKGREILKGVNYASGGAGILDDTGKALGDRISLNMQLRNHYTTAFKIALLLGNATLARYRLNKCLYIVNMGNNDYLNNYLQPKYYRTSTLYTPQEYAAFLIKQYSMQLRTLYEYGARKIVVYEVATLGCLPEVLSITNPTNNKSSCDDSINNAMQLFNNGLKTLIDTLNTNLTDAQFILINATSISLVNYTALGIKVGNAPCCLVSDHPGGLCDPGKDPCSNRNEYAFWDNYHFSEVVNRATAARAYNATLPTDAYPFDIRRLVRN
ncbi:hypothetical protein DH2020_032685 [Rehmannia glutinosa]|uniref:GDSL esterase/lipase n=1 Tax=Rehmannia glutinosa TaxID=99300 RepID=A0ABR0VHD1_REHGL